MNILEITDLNDLQIIFNSEILITHNSSGLHEEINENMWCITLSPRVNLSSKDLLNFLNVLLNKRSEQINQHELNGPITFYMWFDEMALQLRFNFISGCNTLPFSVPIKLIDEPSEIINMFLKMRNWPEPIGEEFHESESEDGAFPVYKKCFKALVEI
jgi:hypothetical protein